MKEFLASGQPVVEFDEVSIGFEGHEVLSNVSFTVAYGETRIVLGPAGGGKSVLMKLANGLIVPDSGDDPGVWPLVGGDERERDIRDARPCGDGLPGECAVRFAGRGR